MADDELSIDDLLSKAGRRRSIIITYDPDTDDITLDRGTASPAEVRDIIGRVQEDADGYLFPDREWAEEEVDPE